MAGISPKQRIWGWMSFDLATQPFYTLLLTFIFGPYFAAVATEHFLASGMTEQLADSRAQSVWSLGQTVAGLLIAFTAPILGAFADATGRRLPWVVVFSALYVVSTWALWWMLPDGSAIWFAIAAFGLGLIAAEYATIFTNAMLPSLGHDGEIGRISGAGMALGYAGGVVSLFIMLLLLAEGENGTTLIGLKPLFGLDPALREGTRSVGPFTAIWFVLFMAPFFLWMRDEPNAERATVGQTLAEFGRSLRSILKQRSLASYLASSMFYRDALNALYGFGGVYATLVLDWSITQIGIFGILGAIMAAVFTWLGGRADEKLGPRPVIVFTVWVLITVCTVIVGMSRESFFGMPLIEGSPLPDIVFYVLGATIGAAGGALQAASRTMMVRHANPKRPTEAFGLYALSGKATAFLAPAMIGLFTYLTESARLGLSPVIGLFIIALILLRWVHPQGNKGV